MTVQAPARTPATALNAAQVLVVVAMGLAIIGKGAFYRQGQVIAGSVLALAFVLAVLSSPAARPSRGVRRWAIPRPVMLVVLSLFAFGVWAVARGALAGDDLGGVSVLAFAAALSAGVVIGHLATPPQRRGLRRAVIGLAMASAASGWAGLVWRIDSLAIPGRAWRASGTLTYENALACLLVVVAVVVVAELVDRETPAMAVALCVLLVGAAATQSRGGAVALVLGAVPLVAFLGWRPVLRVTWRPAAGAMIAAACLVPSVSVDSTPRPLPAIAGLCLGVLVAVWPRSRLPAPRSLVIGVGLLAVAGAVFALRFAPTDLNAVNLSWSSTHRASEHRAAAAVLVEQPVIGTGPGRAVLRWRDDRGQTLQARFVHNEYLQVAVELGLIGVVLLLVALVAVGRAVWQGRAVGGVPWGGVMAALVATAVHGGIDFVWHLPAIPFVTMLLAGTVTVPHMVGGRPVPDPTASVASTTVQ